MKFNHYFDQNRMKKKDIGYKIITETSISRDHTVKIRPHFETTNIGMCDYIKLELHHQPDVIILHCGKNDISNEVKTLKKLKKFLKEIKGYDTRKKASKSKDMTKILMKILKALMKKFKAYAHPKVCLLLTVVILRNHL